jgi:hypothetical protein
MLNNFYLPELAFIGLVLALILLVNCAPASWAWLRLKLVPGEER